MKTKKEIRNEICNIRDKLTFDEVYHKSSLIQEKVIELPEYQEADHILLYADFRHEVMTKDIFMSALADKKKVYFPKCYEDGFLAFYQVISVRQLHDGNFGIKEPKEDEANKYYFYPGENTLAIVPGVAFDTNGYRVGYGKGYYDRFFEKNKMITRVALAFAEQILDEVPRDLHDMKMDKIVSEKIVYSFLRI